MGICNITATVGESSVEDIFLTNKHFNTDNLIEVSHYNDMSDVKKEDEEIGNNISSKILGQEYSLKEPIRTNETSFSQEKVSIKDDNDISETENHISSKNFYEESSVEDTHLTHENSSSQETVDVNATKTEVIEENCKRHCTMGLMIDNVQDDMSAESNQERISCEWEDTNEKEDEIEDYRCNENMKANTGYKDEMVDDINKLNKSNRR